MKTVIISLILLLSCSASAHASSVQYVDNLDGLSFMYEAKEWDLLEGSVSGMLILTRKPKRGSGRIIIARRGRAIHLLNESSTTIEVTRAGRRYAVSCSAKQDDYMFAFFSCKELAKSMSVDHREVVVVNDDLRLLPSSQSISKSPLQRAVYMLLAGADGCPDAGSRIRDAASRSPRLSVIADRIEGKKARARNAARKLVDRNAQPLDYILLGLSSNKRSDIDAWRSAYACGKASGSLIDYWQGVVAQREGRIEEAATFFERAYGESHSDLAAARFAQIAMDAGDMDGARRWWKATDDASLVKASLTIELARRDDAPEDSLWVFDHYEGAWCGSLGARAATSAARAAKARGQRKRTRSLLNRAVAFDKSYGPAYKLLVQMAVEDGQDDEEVAKVLRRYLPHASKRERQHLLSVIDGITRSTFEVDGS